MAFNRRCLILDGYCIHFLVSHKLNTHTYISRQINYLVSTQRRLQTWLAFSLEPQTWDIASVTRSMCGCKSLGVLSQTAQWSLSALGIHSESCGFCPGARPADFVRAHLTAVLKRTYVASLAVLSVCALHALRIRPAAVIVV